MNDAPERVTIDTPVAFRDPLPDAVDVAVIGGGVIGVFTALYLARAGKRVLLCEKGRIAGEQSSRNWGWIRQQGRDLDELPIMIRALQLWHEVNREVNGGCGIRSSGTTYLASSDDALERHAAWVEHGQAAGLDTRILSPAEIAEMFGDQADGRWVGALHTSSDACGEPWRAVPTVAGLAHSEGALIREDCAVRALDIAGGRVVGIVTEDGRVRCDRVVLAGGAWSSLFARRHGVDLPQLSVKATVMRTDPLPSFFSGNAADEQLAMRRRQDGGYSLAPTDVHDIYVGPDAFRHLRTYRDQVAEGWRSLRFHARAPSGFPDAWGTSRRWSEDAKSPFEKTRVLEPRPDPRDISGMTGRFADRFPRIGRPGVRTAWAGMIDTMPDIVPVVDHAPSPEGLIIATGMSGHGFGIGPGFGEITARMAMGQTLEEDMTRFRLSRFTDGSRLSAGPAI